MPGNILYRDSKAKLESLRKEHRDLFDNHGLYLEVVKILDAYTFKLTVRRDILNLFTENAKLRFNVKDSTKEPSTIHTLSSLSSDFGGSVIVTPVKEENISNKSLEQ